MPEASQHRISIDSEWALVDLYRFPHSYTQVYAFLYSLSQTGRLSTEGVTRIYQRHPWRGGYSAVNFYTDLYHAMEEEHRPMVHAIRYSSPGFIEIVVLVALATQIRRIVTAIAQSVETVEETYHRIYKRAQERKLLAMDVRKHEREFAREEIEFMKESSRELAKAMHFDGLDKLEARTQDSLGTLKILLSFYRRVRELVSFQETRKVRFDDDERRQIDDKSA